MTLPFGLVRFFGKQLVQLVLLLFFQRLVGDGKGWLVVRKVHVKNGSHVRARLLLLIADFFYTVAAATRKKPNALLFLRVCLA